MARERIPPSHIHYVTTVTMKRVSNARLTFPIQFICLNITRKLELKLERESGKGEKNQSLIAKNKNLLLLNDNNSWKDRFRWRSKRRKVREEKRRMITQHEKERDKRCYEGGGVESKERDNIRVLTLKHLLHLQATERFQLATCNNNFEL